jgi:hypothetical protein
VLGTINVTVIGDLYSGHERTEAIGYNSSVLYVAVLSIEPLVPVLPLLFGATGIYGFAQG